jgi:hypothetical protein
MPVLLLHAIDFEEARALFGSGDEKRCALILKSVPKAGGDARALSRAVTALICGAEGQVISDAEPFGTAGARRLDAALAEAFPIVLSDLARGRPASIEAPEPERFWKDYMQGHLDRLAGAERNPWRRLRRRPLFGVDSSRDPRWGGLSREETAAFAAALPASPEAPSPEFGTWYVLLRQKVTEAARDGLGLWSLGTD